MLVVSRSWQFLQTDEFGHTTTVEVYPNGGYRTTRYDGSYTTTSPSFEIFWYGPGGELLGSSAGIFNSPYVPIVTPPSGRYEVNPTYPTPGENPYKDEPEVIQIWCSKFLLVYNQVGMTKSREILLMRKLLGLYLASLVAVFTVITPSAQAGSRHNFESTEFHSGFLPGANSEQRWMWLANHLNTLCTADRKTASQLLGIHNLYSETKQVFFRITENLSTEAFTAKFYRLQVIFDDEKVTAVQIHFVSMNQGLPVSRTLQSRPIGSSQK